MDFGVIFQLKAKRYWWVDVILYFVVSLFIATILCYFIFLIKNNIQKKTIDEITLSLETVGTEQQKEQEKEVMYYQKKIADFAALFKNHEFASNVFAFMEKQTMGNIWFNQFALDRKGSQVQLFGESNDMEDLSIQISSLERNEYVKNVTGLNSILGDFGKINFTFLLSLEPKIFTYLPEMNPESELVPNSLPEIQTEDGQEAGVRSNQKLITVFDVVSDPEIQGKVDQTNYAITLDFPFGTDISNLNTFIVVSPEATVSPGSGAPQNFTNPVIYTVTAQDGSTQNYTVNANILPKEGGSETESGSGVFAVIALTAAILLAVFGIIFFSIRNIKKKNSTQIE